MRKYQIIIFVLATCVGMMMLFQWQPKGYFSWANNLLSPIKNEAFRIGAKIEDKTGSSAGEKIMRKVSPPSYSAMNYLLCEIDDDPEGVNAYGIYHPVDIAITLHNLTKLGIKRIFIGTYLSWPTRDPEEISTLSTAMRKFDSVVVTAPLRRNITNQPIPAAFLAASIPLSEVIGATELIPIVNSTAINIDINLPSNSYAGFSAIESEKSVQSIPMIAVWDQRIVFSSILLGLMQYSKVSPDQLHIEVGKYIRIGNSGNIIPIDSYGHFRPNANYKPKDAPRKITSAQSTEASVIGATQKDAILSAYGDNASKYAAISTPYDQIAQLAHTPRVFDPKIIKRIPNWLEILLIINCSLMASWLFSYSKFKRQIAFLIALMVTWLIFVSLYHLFNFWSPVPIYFMTITSGWLLSIFLPKQSDTSILKN